MPAAQRRQRLRELAEQLAGFELELSFGVEAAADLGLLIPALRVDSYHRTLAQAIDLEHGAGLVAQTLDRLARSIAAEHAAIVRQAAPAVDRSGAPLRPQWLDWWVSAFSVTPWHATIYGGVVGVGVVLIAAGAQAVRQGHPWRQALAPGYGLALLGVAGFLASGGLDLAWHTAFGIEADLEALYSPPHLLLAAAGALVATGPLRAMWHRPSVNAAGRWLAVTSLLLLLAILAFFSTEVHPFVHPWAWDRLRPADLDTVALGLPPLAQGGLGSQELAELLGLTGVILHSGLLVALLLLMVRRWGASLPAGWVTAVVGITAAGLSVFHDTAWTVPVAVLGGILGDLAYRWLAPDVTRPGRLRAWAALVPLGLFSVYFAALALLEGGWWAVHLSTGAVALATAAGWLVSYTVAPPALPRHQDSAPV